MALRKISSQSNIPAPKAPSKDIDPDSLESKFDAEPPSSGGFDFKEGRWNMILTAAEFIENEKGTAVKVTYEGYDNEEEEVDGKEIRSYYSLIDAQNEVLKGAGIWKRDVQVLGYEGDDIKFKNLENLCEQITNDRHKVVVNVKRNGQYINVYLQGVAQE